MRYPGPADMRCLQTTRALTVSALTCAMICVLGGLGNMVGAFVDLSNPDIVTTDMLYRHIDHIVNLVGIDHVGFGSDWIPDITFTAEGVQTPLGDLFFPDGGYTRKMGAKGVPTPAPFQIVGALVDTLLGHGWTEEDCGKFLGGNLYRVFDQVW